jgi:hypothetical protein
VEATVAGANKKAQELNTFVDGLTKSLAALDSKVTIIQDKLGAYENEMEAMRPEFLGLGQRHSSKSTR